MNRAQRRALAKGKQQPVTLRYAKYGLTFTVTPAAVLQAIALDESGDADAALVKLIGPDAAQKLLAQNLAQAELHYLTENIAARVLGSSHA